MSPLPPKTSATKTTLPKTTMDGKQRIIAKFKRYKTKNKLSAEDAAKITGYSLRTLQSWMAKLGQQQPKRKTPVRTAFLDDVTEGILQFIRDEFGSGRVAGRCCRPIDIVDVVVKKAEELSPNFNAVTPAAKKQQIYRLLKKFKSELPLPPRPRPRPFIAPKIHACIGEGCENTCRKKNNCPHKRIVNRSFIPYKVVDKHGKGKSLVADANINKGDFIIEYFGKVVPQAVLQKNGGKGIYYMKIRGCTVIDGNIPNNDAKYVNHSCRPNCELGRWEVDDKERPVLFAKTRIKRGTELTFDYDWTVKDAQDQIECRCSAGKNCRKWMHRLDVPSNNILQK